MTIYVHSSWQKYTWRWWCGYVRTPRLDINIVCHPSTCSKFLSWIHLSFQFNKNCYEEPFVDDRSRIASPSEWRNYTHDFKPRVVVSLLGLVVISHPQENNQRCSRCRMVGVKGSITSPCQSSESRFGVISSFYSKWVGQRCSYTNKSINIHHHFLNQRYVDQYCNGIRSPTLELKAWIEIPIEPRFSGWFEILRKYIVFT